MNSSDTALPPMRLGEIVLATGRYDAMTLRTAGTGTIADVEVMEEEGGAGEDLAPFRRPSNRDFFTLLTVSSCAPSWPLLELLTVASTAE